MYWRVIVSLWQHMVYRAGHGYNPAAFIAQLDCKHSYARDADDILLTSGSLQADLVFEPFWTGDTVVVEDQFWRVLSRLNRLGVNPRRCD